MLILGISAFYHDSAATLINDEKIIAAVQEERFTRIKHDPNFPINSIKYVLKENNSSLEKIDAIIFYEKPFLKFERLIETYILNSPKGFSSFIKAMPIWLKDKLFQKKLIIEKLKTISKNFNSEKIFFSHHHMSHSASAFFPSPFEKAVILTLDGVGEWASSTVAIGNKNKIVLKKEINFPHSLGLLYSAFTYYLGFKVNSGEYKIMGLAPYGSAKYKDLILSKLIDLKEDGSFRLNQSYFNYSTGLTMTNKKFSKLFGNKRRSPETEKINQFHMDVAASIQKVLEHIILKIIQSLSKEYNIDNLCLAGGVALNCVANSAILNDKSFKNIWIQPASGDAGGSLGAALYLFYDYYNNKRIVDKNDRMQGSYLGPSYDNDEIHTELKALEANFIKFDENELIKITAKELKNEKVIGWFQGRMEFGPRALGNRSIIADPRSDKMQKTLNLKIKYRESFRPFAPSVLFEKLNNFFELTITSPYMLLTANVKKEICNEMSEDEKKLFGISKLNIKRSEIPAVTHVDYSARIQTVHKETNLKYHKLISEFEKITGYPVIVNTSFNIRGEPIVSSVSDAFNCFMGTEMDILVIGNFLLEKKAQNLKLLKSYKNNFKLD